MYASRPTTKVTGYEILLYVLLYSARSWYINQEKLVGYELLYLLRPWILFFFFFDAIVSHLIAVKLLRSQKFSDLLALESPPGLCLRSQPAKIIALQSLFSLIKLNLLPKNRHSLKCLNKFLNQGRKIATETNNWSINELAQDIKPYNV